MKKTNSILVLLSLLLLASCGQGGKTSATLKVSSSFALSNSGFDGGFVLYGKNGNQSFSRAVPYSAGSAGNVVDIVLPNGKWTFYATAWDDLGNGPMTGNIFCGEISTDLLGADKKVNLSVSQAACDSPSFVNTAMRETTGPNKVKKLGLISCNGFYEWSAGGVPTPIITTTAYSFCSSNDVPLDFRNKASYFKVKVMSKSISNGVLAGELSSGCLPFNNTPANGVSSVRLTDLRIPSSNTPVHIGLYRDSNCTDSVSQQPMLEGLSFNYGDDKFFLNNVVHGGLVIASNEARKGYSHFIDILPSFKCSTNVCVAQHLTGPYEYYAARPLSASPLRINIDYDPSTPAVNYTITPSGNWAFSGGSQATACGKNDETFYCDFVLATSCSDPGSNNCFSSHASNPIFNFNFQKPGVSVLKRAYVFKNKRDLSALQTAYNFTGRLDNSPIMNDEDRLDEEDVQGGYGLVGYPRMILSPEIGGLVSFPGQSCSSASGSRQIQFREDGQFKDYEISIGSNIDLGIGNNLFEKIFFCQASNLNPGSCLTPGAPYEKRITVKRLIGPGNWEKFISMDFSCDENLRSGRFQEHHTEYFSGTNVVKRREKTAIGWFTPPGSDKERIEIYSGSREYDTSSIETRYEAMFSRLFKTSSSNFSIDGMIYSREYSGSNFDENAARFFIELSTSFLQYDFLPIRKTGSTLGADIFNSVTAADYIFEGEDIRPVVARASVQQKIDLNNMSSTTGSYLFTGSGPSSTSLGGLPLKIDSLKPVPYFQVFDDNFF